LVSSAAIVPEPTITSEPFGSGLCSFNASLGGAVSHVSISSFVHRMTGIALGCAALGAVGREAPGQRLPVSLLEFFVTAVQLL
jgi:hypothetical protein